MGQGRRLLLCFLFLFATPGAASIDISLGWSSPTSGRMVPALSAAWNRRDWAFTGFSTGVQSEFHYYSGYMAGAYRHWAVGEFWGQKISAGFGAGLYYYKLGFRDGPDARLDEDSDLALGPAFRIVWQSFDPFFINMEAMYGLRGLFNPLLLNSQDVAIFSLGIRL